MLPQQHIQPPPINLPATAKPTFQVIASQDRLMEGVLGDVGQGQVVGHQPRGSIRNLGHEDHAQVGDEDGAPPIPAVRALGMAIYTYVHA